MNEFELARDVPGMLLAWCGSVDSIMFSFEKYSNLDVWIDYLHTWLEKKGTFPSTELEARVTFTMFSALAWRRLGDARTYEWEKRVQVLLEHVPDYVSTNISGLPCLLYVVLVRK